ncbi:hypothetical protein COU36_05205 [Candidatus Micrarchaeota archaeon CG10_big_fil_rev_8_21_14_0_10_59_7]|nr:MAG: hypothetical protein COU36_05205 [Candidatus Micrarchaeota archaeon CG10_big_fil_rev_8_21_14_0_10_59_7]
MDIACPQCGNPNLQVDEANSVVYCQKCGFAVKVDPATGNVTPISQGGPQPGSGNLAPPPVYKKPGIFGMDPLTFFMLALSILLLVTFLYNLDLTILGVGVAVLALVYWKIR